MEANMEHYSTSGAWEKLQNPAEIHVQKSSNTYLQGKVNKLTTALSGGKGRYNFIVYKSPSTYVMHTSGGTIYIPEGLLRLAKNDTEIAFILGHEVAHWENGDIKNNMAKVPFSPGQVRESECLADIHASETLKRLYGKKISAIIDNFLDRLAKKYRRNQCDTP